MKRRIFSLLLSLALLLTLLPVQALASQPENRKVTVRYVADHIQKQGDASLDFTYSDRYFDGDARTYRQDLAVMSFGLALSAFSSRDATKAKDYATENRNFVSLMKQCGFRNAESNRWMKEPPTTSSIGVSTAWKKMDSDTALVAVGIRGDLYRSEWGGNLELGSSGPHKNWIGARSQVLQFVKDYLKSQGITGRVKLWIAGYSRSAAVANLVGGALDDGYSLGSKVSLSPADTYCYTFEAPMGAIREEALKRDYSNIHNIISENDIVTAIPPKHWNFCRYGVDHILPSRRSTGNSYAAWKEKESAKLKEIPNELFNFYWPDLYQAYGVDLTGTDGSFTVRKVAGNQKELYETLGKALTTTFVTSREDYVENVQKYLMDLFTAYYSLGDRDVSISRIVQKTLQNVQTRASSIFSSLLTSPQEAADSLLSCVTDAMKDEGAIDYDLEQIKTMLGVLTPRLARMARAYPGTTYTVLANIINILAAHDTAANLSWMLVLPESYLTSHTAVSAAG